MDAKNPARGRPSLALQTPDNVTRRESDSRHDRSLPPIEDSQTQVLASRETSTEAQRLKLLALLKSGPQTTFSLRRHGLVQSATRIFELRRQGYVITTTPIIAVDADGFTHVRVARYELLDYDDVTTSSARCSADGKG